MTQQTMEKDKPDFSRGTNIWGLEPVTVKAEIDPPIEEKKELELDVIYAGLGNRIIAALLDILILFFPLLFIEILLFDNIEDPSNYFAMNVIAVIVWTLYYGVTESSERQATLGKQICGLKVIDKEGKRPSFIVAALRFLAQTISAIPLGFGYLAITLNDRNQAWHDMMLRCYVIKKKRATD